jgi:sirohydrochlorin cobaltochelatase
MPRDAALLLLGHGSTLNADSSAPTYQHAEEIRRRNVFAEVHVGFWKEEPNFRQALRQTRCRRVYVVPNFISSGYFTEQIIPRELGLAGPVTKLGRQTVYYCDPVGLHPSMTAALLHRAHEVTAQSAQEISAPEKSACLFICGHGTSLNDNSTKIIHEQAELIRARNIYRDCQAVLMEQRPFVKDWRTLTDCPDVIVVPFFISDGLHSFEDIPVLLGLTHNIKEKGFTNPHVEGSRRLWYAQAIGTEPSMADVILAQVEQFDAEDSDRDSGEPSDAERSIADDLEAFLGENRGPWKMGQVLIRKNADDVFELRHEDDGAVAEETLITIFSLKDLRDWIRADREENFRPLRAAPNLRRSWIMRANDMTELQSILDYLYPAEVANGLLWSEKKLPTTAWQETAERQSGRFRVVREIDGAGIQELVANVCERGCLKRRLWAPVEKSVEAGRNEIPLLCPEACNYLIGKAREKLKGPEEE